MPAKTKMIGVTQGLFTLAVICFCISLALSTLADVACGPAASPAPTWYGLPGTDSPCMASEPSGSGVGSLAILDEEQ